MRIGAVTRLIAVSESKWVSDMRHMMAVHPGINESGFRMGKNLNIGKSSATSGIEVNGAFSTRARGDVPSNVEVRMKQHLIVVGTCLHQIIWLRVVRLRLYPKNVLNHRIHMSICVYLVSYVSLTENGDLLWFNTLL
jgi:hypothetical protein